MPDPDPGSSPAPTPTRALRQASEEMYDVEDAEAIAQRARKIARQAQELADERHDEYDAATKGHDRRAAPFDQLPRGQDTTPALATPADPVLALPLLPYLAPDNRRSGEGFSRAELARALTQSESVPVHHPPLALPGHQRLTGRCRRGARSSRQPNMK